MNQRTKRRLLACLTLISLLAVCLAPCASALTMKAKVKNTGKFYSKPKKSSKAVKINKGATVSITAINRGCARVRYKKHTGYMPTGNLKPNAKTKVQKAVALALYQCGKPYGYDDPKSFNCSSLVSYCYKKAGFKMKGDVKNQARDSRHKLVHSKSFKMGDLLFFDENKDGKADHVGIYVKNNSMVEASKGAGKVRVKKITSWYRSHILCVRRP